MVNSEFYSPPQRSVFEIVLFFYNKETEQSQKYYFDVFSDCVKHDSYFVIKSFQEFFKTKFWMDLNILHLSIWMDNGI